MLVPQPRTRRTWSRCCAPASPLGLRAFPVRLVGGGAAARSRARDRAAARASSPVGGSSVAGSMGYVDAARELAAQVRAGELPEPDVCVVALGSGGTAAGLAAGFAAEGLRTRVVGVVRVARRRGSLRVARARSRAPAPRERGARERAGAHATRASHRHALPRRRLRPRDRAGRRGDARSRARRPASTLDPTYTAKAFASALWHVRARRAETRPLLAHALERADGAVARGRSRRGAWTSALVGAARRVTCRRA